MKMAPSQPHNYLRPSPSTTLVFVDTVSAGSNYFQNLLSGFDTQKFLPIAAIAATVGLGTAAFYFQNRSGQGHVPSAQRCKSKTQNKRSKKSNRVIFQSPLKNGNAEEALVNENDSAKSSDSNLITDEGAEATIFVQSSEFPKEAGSQKEGAEQTDENNNVMSENDEEPEIAPQEHLLILKQCPRGRKTPCIAPFPLKLETFLRVHKLKYELDFNGHEPRLYGSPWIRFNTEDITDSQNVLRFLIDQYNLKTERELTPEQLAMATAYTHLLENHLYWGIAIWRWVYDGARSLKEIQLLPKKTRDLIPDVCKTVEQAAWFHGIGKMTPMEVRHSVLQDLRSLSEFLGNKDYFLNTPYPTELDCTAFGMLSQFLWNMHGPFHEAVVNEYTNLRDFCWRIRLNYWPDWDECLNNTQFYTDEPYPVADSINYPY